MMEFFKVAVICFCLFASVQSYVFTWPQDTSSGYCKISNDLKIPVGQDLYDNGECRKWTCEEGRAKGEGCGVIGFDRSDTKCRLVRGSGNYPDCCERVECN